MTLLNNNIIHLTSKLSFTTSVRLFKRFYPGYTFGFNITKSTSQRLLNLFMKDPTILKNAAALEEWHLMKNKLYQIKENRSELFKTIRTIATKKEIIFTRKDLQNPETSLVITLYAKYIERIRSQDLIVKNIDCSSQQLNKEKGLTQPLRNLSLEEKKEIFRKKLEPLIKEGETIKEDYLKNSNFNHLWDFLEKWNKHLQTRGTIEPFYTREEKNIQEFLIKVFQENTELKETILEKIKNKDELHSLKLQSNLPNTESLEKMRELKVIEINMLSKNKPGSENYVNSIKYTGQSDCDMKLVLQRTEDSTQYSLYLDIKQKELDPINDMKYLYLKTNYNLTGKNAFGILDNPAYAQTYVDMCIVNLGNIDNIKEVSDFLSEMNNFNNIKDQLLYLYEFILLNVNKHPSIQMAVMCTVDIEPTNKVYQGASEEYVSKMPDDVLTNPKSFDKFSKDIYKRFLEMNSNDSSKTSHIENIKKRLMNDKVFKPHFVTNKDYYDIEDK